MRSATLDRLGEFSKFIERKPAVQEKVGVPKNRVQWSPNFVAHVCEEIALGRARGGRGLLGLFLLAIRGKQFRLRVMPYGRVVKLKHATDSASPTFQGRDMCLIKSRDLMLIALEQFDGRVVVILEKLNQAGPLAKGFLRLLTNCPTRGTTKECLAGWIDVDDPTVGIDDDDRVGKPLYHRVSRDGNEREHLEPSDRRKHQRAGQREAQRGGVKVFGAWGPARELEKVHHPRNPQGRQKDHRLFAINVLQKHNRPRQKKSRENHIQIAAKQMYPEQGSVIDDRDHIRPNDANPEGRPPQVVDRVRRDEDHREHRFDR